MAALKLAVGITTKAYLSSDFNQPVPDRSEIPKAFKGEEKENKRNNFM